MEQPGGGGSEAGHAEVHLGGAAGLWAGAYDGERGLSGAVGVRMCVPRGLAEAWALLMG